MQPSLQLHLRYADTYFIIDYGNDEYAKVIFNRFGRFIKALEVSFLDEEFDRYNWLWPKIHHVQKLAFTGCTVMSTKILPQAVDIRHITGLRLCGFSAYNDYGFAEIIIHEFRNLEELEIKCTDMCYDSLQRTIRNNPKLQTLILHNFINFYDCSRELTQIFTLIAVHLKKIKKVVFVNGYNWTIAVDAMNAFDENIDSFMLLESLTLTPIPNIIELW